MISMKVEGLMRQLAALEAAKDALASSDQRVPAQCVAAVAGIDAKQNAATFGTEGEKSGSRWAPLSPGYAKEKRAAVGNKKILVRTGGMRNSLANLSDQHHVARADGSFVVVGTKHPHAAKHQHGGRFSEQVQAKTRKPGNSPKRYSHVRAHVRRYTLPARPVVRKSGAQRLQLILAMRKGICLYMAASTTGSVSRMFRQRAGSITPDARV